jgi:hypothetical protein
VVGSRFRVHRGTTTVNDDRHFAWLLRFVRSAEALATGKVIIDLCSPGIARTPEGVACCCSGCGASVSITSAVVAAIVALLGVLGYQNRRARLSAVRGAFNDVVTGLASDDSRQQLAAAVLLRRFFDSSSELGVRDFLGRRRCPYSGEAFSRNAVCTTSSAS